MPQRRPIVRGNPPSARRLATLAERAAREDRHPDPQPVTFNSYQLPPVVSVGRLHKTGPRKQNPK